MSSIVRLTSTGEYVNVATKQGANAFLEQPSGAFNFFSTELKNANAIRKREIKKGKLNNSDRQALCDIYAKIDNVGYFGDLELFHNNVPKRELEAWLNHAVGTLQKITNDRKWINTGNFLKHDSDMISFLFGLFLHPKAVVLIFEEIKVLETISVMMSALGKQPSIETANVIINVVEPVYDCCRSKFDKKWKAEKIFKKLESTGILQHYLRCSAIKGSDYETTVSGIFDELLRCTAYVHKSFQEGTPCGDAVREIVKGTPPPPALMLPFFNSLVQLSKTTYVKGNALSACNYCHKSGSEVKLLHCDQCTWTSYCSEECQRADWKSHKKFCVARIRSRDQKNASATQELVYDFLYNKAYVHIMCRMVEESEKAGGVSFHEMVVELDLFPDSSGTIPMMKDTPEFHVVPLAKYFDGTWFNDPSSLVSRLRFPNETERDGVYSKLLAVLKSEQSTKSAALCSVSKWIVWISNLSKNGGGKRKRGLVSRSSRSLSQFEGRRRFRVAV